MGKMEFESQICTTKEQSERLLALGLSANTADMSYYIDEMYGSYNSYLHPHPPTIKGVVPAWSLHRLIDIIALTYGSKWGYLELPYANPFEDCIERITELINNKDIKPQFLEG